MFRKIRRPTPDFKIPPPYNVLTGEYQNLRNLGIGPYCALVQVAADDTYDDYVICRGYDPQMMRFIDYESGNQYKPGISVAKPYGDRMANRYEIGEVYPALLPIQGTEQFTPPSPVGVDWRLGQNPGVASPATAEGHPEDLDSSIDILYDHNGLVVNWLIIQTSAAASVIPLAVTQVNGSNGTSSTPATWTYDVNHAITNESLLTNVDPTAAPHTYDRRPPAGRLYAATTGTGYYNDDGDLVIYELGEYIDPGVC